jgi:hypothetical protein
VHTDHRSTRVTSGVSLRLQPSEDLLVLKIDEVHEGGTQPGSIHLMERGHAAEETEVIVLLGPGSELARHIHGRGRH